MGSEFTALMGDTSFDHDVSRTVFGDTESLRERLTSALEQMGYRVLNENPIQARRVARGSAKSGCSQDILNNGRTLDIGLKSAGANATRLTFAYTVKGVYSGYLSKGDRNTLTREAEAIIALVQSRADLSQCPACGADGASGVRFCRQCGAPVAADEPPELELLRFTAEANAAYKSMAIGAICILVGLLTSALIILFMNLFPHDIRDAKLFRVLTVMVGFVCGPGVILLLAGLWRLARTINHKPDPEGLLAPSRRGITDRGAILDTAELPPQSPKHQARPSITEVTTGLLPQEVKRTNDLN